MTDKPKPTGLVLLRVPFQPHQISRLPKPYKRDSPKGKCPECGGYHGLPAVHLDYVGHAALTDRLLDADINWTWEPMGFAADGSPAFDRSGGLWIRLTVNGVTRPGYGAADGKTGGDAVKEIIGDALRNAAMRFGAALDLWHKGDLHIDQDTGEVFDNPSPPPAQRVLNPATGRMINPMSPNQARKDGRGERYDALRHEIPDLTAVTECIAWGLAHKAEFDGWPEAWRNDIRAELSQHMSELRALVAGETLEGDDVPDFPGDR